MVNPEKNQEKTKKFGKTIDNSVKPKYYKEKEMRGEKNDGKKNS